MSNQDVMLLLAISDEKAFIILSMIDRTDIFQDITEGISANTKLELVSEKKTLEAEMDGVKVIYKGSMKEYEDVAGDGTFVMTDSQRFSIQFGEYRYIGFLPKGTRGKIKDEVKEIVFDVTNTITVGTLATHLGVNQLTITGIRNIIA